MSDSPAPTLKGRNTIVRLLDRYALDQFRGARIDTDGLSNSLRSVVTLGYISFIAIMLLALMLDLFGARLSPITFNSSAHPAPHTIHAVALLATLASYAIGWAFLMTGAVFARRIFCIVILVVFVVLNTMGLVYANDVSDLALIPLLIVSIITLALRFGQTKFTATNNPLIVLIIFLLALGLSIASFIAFSAPANRAEVADSLFTFMGVPVSPIWLLSGLSLISFAISVGHSVVSRLRNSMSESALKRLIAFVLVAHPLISGLAAAVLMGGAIGAYLAPVVAQDAVLGLPLVLAFLILVVRKKWTGSNAAVLLGVRIALFMFTLAYLIITFSGFNIADPVNGTLEKLSVLPPSLFYMGGMVLSLLSFFVPFANTESNTMPRTARVPLALGCAILVVSMMFFLLNSVNVDTGENLASDSFFSNLFFIGVLVLGLPFLVFTALRRKENLVGSSSDWAQAAEQPNKPHRAAIAFVLLIPVVTVVCACGMFAGTFLGFGK